MNTTQNTVRFRRLILAIALLAVAASALPATAAEGGKVNVNEASAEQLALLPRVGPAVAQRIIDHRTENGAFEELEDLMLVRGIGEKTFELIAPHATLSGETTLTEKVRVRRAAEEESEAGDAGEGAESDPAK